MSKPLVEIVVVTYNSLRYLPALLESVRAITYPEYRVTVVDNASTDGTPDYLKVDWPLVRLIQNVRNVGYGAANNAAIRAAFLHRADYVLILNPDTVVTPDFLDVLISVALESGFDMASPLALDETGCAVECALSMLLRENPRWADDLASGHFAASYELTRLVGASILISRAAFAVTGGFDPAFFLFYEDYDLCRLAHSAGMRLGVVPGSKIRHISELNKAGRITVARFFHSLRGGVVYHLTAPDTGVVLNSVRALAHIARSLILAPANRQFLSTAVLMPAVVCSVLSNLAALLAKRRRQVQIIRAHRPPQPPGDPSIPDPSGAMLSPRRPVAGGETARSGISTKWSE